MLPLLVNCSLRGTSLETAAQEIFMTGIHNRLPDMICEVGTCFKRASFSEWVTVIPGDPALRHERHQIDIVLCHQHEAEFQESGLLGTVTAYGDQVAERIGTEA